MATAIEKLGYLTVGHVKLGKHGANTGSVKLQVHDGDTISVEALGNFGIRFLGIDAPEVSFTLPGKTSFTPIDNPKWETFLSDPFAGALAPFSPAIDPGLATFLQNRVGPGCATNHADHADLAEKKLVALISEDMQMLAKDTTTFAFFLTFAYEITDSYGRLLCFVNCDKADLPRPVTYNERLLQLGMVSPYFMWPNIDPFKKESSIDKAVPKPETLAAVANKDNLGKARKWVKEARTNGLGTFNTNTPLKLEPFELRYLSRRVPPNRWVIDLTKSDSTLLKPQNYFTIPYAEDRLFVDKHYVPLFVKHDWKEEG